MPKKRTRPARNRCWCFTINNPTVDDEARLLEIMINDRIRAHHGIRYIIWTEEDAGTEHWQGYVEFTTAKRATQVIKTLPRAHLEPRKGTQREAIAYVKKFDSTFVDFGFHGEAGTPAKQIGDHVVDAIMGGAKLKDIIREYPQEYLSRHSGIEKMVSNQVKPRKHKMEIEIFMGATGSGKSWKANHDYPNAYYATWPTGGRW